MAYKYFGRLAGSTAALDAVSSTAPVSTVTPYSSVLPATKFIAYGENATSMAFNRALSALSVNTDALAGTLDSVAVRSEILEPSLNGSGGYTALAGLAGGSVLANLGAAGAGVKRPVTWLFVGQHLQAINRYVQLERLSARADGKQLLTPFTVYANGADAAQQTSYFPTTTYLGGSSSENAPILKIPGVTPVRCDLPPFAGAAVNGQTDVASWDADGCYLQNKSWEDLYARPGCLVDIKSNVVGSPNIGLYRIASLAGGTGNATSKAVLTRAYTEVTVANGAVFNVGDLVGWQPEPVNPQGTAVDYVHRAYVLYKIPTGVGTVAVLYLSDFGGSEDLKIQGTSVADKVDSTTKGTASLSRYGLIDTEASATQNASLRAGVLLLNLATVGAGQVQAHSSTVSAVTPANHPLRFNTTAAQYSAVLCGPPGYLLNPVIHFPGSSLGGDFRVHGFTLSTAAENLRSGSSSSSRGSFVPSTRLEFSAAYQEALEQWIRWVRRGDDTNSGAGYSPHLLSSTRQSLGDGVWRAQVTAPSISPAIPAGTVLTVSPGYKIEVIRTSGNEIWFKHVHAYGTVYGQTANPIAAQSTFQDTSNPPVTYTIQFLNEPRLEFRDSANPQGAPTLYVPDEGLNAAYNNHYSANPFLRGNRGTGNKIAIANLSPVTAVLPVGNSQAAFQVESPQQGNGQDYTVIRSGPVNGTPNAIDMALEVVDGTTLRIKDGNATTGVKFSGSGTANSALDPTFTYADNMIGCINAGTGAVKVHRQLFTKTLLLGAEVTASAGLGNPGLNVNIADAELVGPDGQHVRSNSQFTQNFPLAANSISNLYSDGIQFQVAGGPLPTATIPIARITTSNTAVTQILDMRWLAGNLDQKLDIHVGGYGAHFQTVYAAVEFIKNAGLFGPDYTNRRWRVLVRGPTTETQVIQFANLQKGILIEGFGEGSEIKWGVGMNRLFDLNGADDLVFRNLHLVYEDAAAAQAASVVQRSVFYNAGNLNSDNVLIERVSVAANTANRLSCFASLVNIDRLTIRDCVFTGATDVGIQLSNSSRALIENCEIVQSGTPQVTPGVTDHAGIYVYSAPGSSSEHVTIKGTLVSGWPLRGISGTRVSEFKVLSCRIGDTASGAGQESFGILVDKFQELEAFCAVISDCHVVGVQAGTNAYGIWVGPTKSVVVNNVVRLIGSAGNANNNTGYHIAGHRTRVLGNVYVSAGFGQETGIRSTGAFNIIDANQTNGKTIDAAGFNNSVGAMNRDDPYDGNQEV